MTDYDYNRPWNNYYVQLTSATDKNGKKLSLGDKYKYSYGLVGYNNDEILTVAAITTSAMSNYMIWSVESQTWSGAEYVTKVEKTDAPVKGRFIVCLEENGKFAPAKTPKEYTTRSRADKVAIEMAEKHDGVFYVLQVVGRTELKKTVKAEITNL